MKTTVILTMLAIAAAQSVNGADIKNWPRWMQPKQSQPAISTPASPAQAMDCLQCTSATVVTKRDLVTGKPGHGFRYSTQTVHQCPGCRDTLARKSGTKATEFAHTCTASAEKTLCCDTSRASGRTS